MSKLHLGFGQSGLCPQSSTQLKHEYDKQLAAVSGLTSLRESYRNCSRSMPSSNSSSGTSSKAPSIASSLNGMSHERELAAINGLTALRRSMLPRRSRSLLRDISCNDDSDDYRLADAEKEEEAEEDFEICLDSRRSRRKRRTLYEREEGPALADSLEYPVKKKRCTARAQTADSNKVYCSMCKTTMTSHNKPQLFAHFAGHFGLKWLRLRSAPHLTHWSYSGLSTLARKHGMLHKKNPENRSGAAARLSVAEVEQLLSKSNWTRVLKKCINEEIVEAFRMLQRLVADEKCLCFFDTAKATEFNVRKRSTLHLPAEIRAEILGKENNDKDETQVQEDENETISCLSAETTLDSSFGGKRPVTLGSIVGRCAFNSDLRTTDSSVAHRLRSKVNPFGARSWIFKNAAQAASAVVRAHVASKQARTVFPTGIPAFSARNIKSQSNQLTARITALKQELAKLEREQMLAAQKATFAQNFENEFNRCASEHLISNDASTRNVFFQLLQCDSLENIPDDLPPQQQLRQQYRQQHQRNVQLSLPSLHGSVSNVSSQQNLHNVSTNGTFASMPTFTLSV
ncbi:MAG: hypothetical protein MHM6MM_000901 [Cercozoa sp. M6MM]